MKLLFRRSLVSMSLLWTFSAQAQSQEAAPSSIRTNSPPSREAVYAAFGARESLASGLEFEQVRSSSIELVNLLIVIGLESDARALMNAKSTCGARAHQAMTTRSGPSGTIWVTWSCDGLCEASVEEKSQNGTVLSEKRTLPPIFCDRLWGGAVKVLDKNGL